MLIKFHFELPQLEIYSYNGIVLKILYLLEGYLSSYSGIDREIPAPGTAQNIGYGRLGILVEGLSG